MLICFSPLITLYLPNTLPNPVEWKPCATGYDKV